jgi:D-amino-acid dehydrogenase
MRWVIRRTNSLRGVDVAVVGGGAVGISTALELAQRGASVAVLERGPELAWGCSAGNAGIVGPGHVVPLADPAAVRDGLRWMARPDSPFYVRPSPAVIPWLGRFAAAAAPGRVRKSRSVLRALAMHSASLHASLAAAGVDTGYRRAGLLNVFHGDRAFRDACRQARSDALDGIVHQVLTDDDLRGVGVPFAEGVAGTILQPDEAYCDPGRYVSAIGAQAEDAGVIVRAGTEVLDVRTIGGRIDTLWTTRGDLAVGELVIAAGVWSPQLSSALGLELPIEAGKGYHVDVPAERSDPELPIWLHEDRVVITPLGERVRFAGTLELSGLDHDVSRRRVEAISAAVARLLPGLAARPPVDVWRGLRPCTPDGLPVIGRVPAIENATLATGHGMWGLQLAPVTAMLVAQVIAGQAPTHDLTPFRPGRFELGSRAPAEAPPPFTAGVP